MALSAQESGDRRPTPLPLRPAYAAPQASMDLHTAARLGGPTVKHLDLDLSVDFKAHRLAGTAAWSFAPVPEASTLHLDARALEVYSVEASADGKAWTKAAFTMADGPIPDLGQDLQVQLAQGASRVRIHYRTSDHATGLQWLEAAQTAGKKQPFLFSQAQAIHARSFVPCQDSPGIRITYAARLRTPKALRAVMAASFDAKAPRTGDYRFRMEQPIPAYLLALAVGDLKFQPLGARTGVWAEPSVLPKAAKELEDTEKMVAATEALFGPYRWGRYDLLILPPSFPFGGMENPRLTFATPTILAGDKSLVSLVAHELAHSWSGNLVTNATWRDFWLNEGFTTYVERRILEAVYGRDRAEMEAVLGVQTLRRVLAENPPEFQKLYTDLGTHDPDDASTEIPYEKGALLLRQIEAKVGRPAFDRWLRDWFDGRAFQSVTTAAFVAHLRKGLPAAPDPDPWLLEPGFPSGAAEPTSGAFAAVDAQVARWMKGNDAPSKFASGAAGYDLDSAKCLVHPEGWSTQEWLHFLRALPGLGQEPMTALDRAFHLTDSGNAEIAHQWLLLCIRSHYAPADEKLEAYLLKIGRRKLIVPLYQELAKTPEGLARARAIYAKARPGYHPIAQNTLDGLLGKP
jgi:aminopeptidase N